MGTTESIKYEKSTLKKLPSKGDYYYVICTKPHELRRSPSDKQKRISTKTKNHREASKLWDKLEREIYAEFDKALQRDPFINLIEKHWDETKVGFSISEARMSGPAFISGEKEYLVRVLLARDLITDGALNEIFEHLTLEEARKVRTSMEVRRTLREDSPNPYPLHLQQRVAEEEAAEASIVEKREVNSSPVKVGAGKIVNKSGCPTITQLLPEYLQAKKWEKIRNKTKKYIPNYIIKCVEMINDLPIDQVQKFHAIQIAQHLDAEDKAHATIKNYVHSLGGLLDWASTASINHTTEIPVPWVGFNVLKGVDLTDYGKEKRSFEALKVDQLHKLFELDMSKNERLIFILLITTGMRLDEVALLRWDQFKIDENGINYVDLSMNPVKNDRFSSRLVAIPDIVNLPPYGKGRLFDFKLDSDGKSSKDASRYLNENYVHKVRNGPQDDRKVVHSLRHNLTGLMKNLRPTPHSEHMDWITGHDMEGSKTESERKLTYNEDIDLTIKYDIVNRIEHPWLKPLV